MSESDERSEGKDGQEHPKSSVTGSQAANAYARLPMRFYKTAGMAPSDDGFAIRLDGRSVKTPGKRELIVPTERLALAVTAEWSAQEERIDPQTMPLTRFCNTALDAVTDHAAAVADEIAAFSASDLVCYRAATPEGLSQRQSAAWDPIVAWARDELGAHLTVVAGVIPVAQPPEAVAGIRRLAYGLSPFHLAAIHVMTTLTGSALLALAHARGRLSDDEVWGAAHIDEDWQVENWGTDSEASARRDIRRREFEAAARLLALVDA
jgi:chaperone required for assembly of F1-ATPase